MGSHQSTWCALGPVLVPYGAHGGLPAQVDGSAMGRWGSEWGEVGWEPPGSLDLLGLFSSKATFKADLACFFSPLSQDGETERVLAVSLVDRHNNHQRTWNWSKTFARLKKQIAPRTQPRTSWLLGGGSSCYCISRLHLSVFLMANVTLLTFHHVMSKRMIIKQPLKNKHLYLVLKGLVMKEFGNDFL